jgi:hypothetical protein
LAFGNGIAQETVIESEYYYTREELGVVSEEDAKKLVKAANDQEYLKAVAELREVRQSLQYVHVPAVQPVQVTFLEGVVGKFRSWYIDHQFVLPDVNRTAASANGQLLDPRESEAKSSIVSGAANKYEAKHFKEVDKLAKTFKQKDALDKVAEKYKFNREGFEKQYRRRWLDVKRKGK